MFADLLRHPGVEEHAELRSPVGFLALHGGLEEQTAEIAHAAAARADATCYALIQPGDLRWHVPSHRFEPATSPVLDDVLAHCELVISLHGFGRAGFWTSLLLGGRARDDAQRLAGLVRSVLPMYTVLDDVESIPEGLRGLDPRNPVNRCRGGAGVQLEMPPRVRGIGPHWVDTDGDDAFVPHTEVLVDALARFALGHAA